MPPGGSEPGGSGDDWRVHLGYDLLGGRLVGVRVADRHTAEAFELFVVGPEDVLVADRTGPAEPSGRL
jgi:hypothetical protein